MRSPCVPVTLSSGISIKVVSESRALILSAWTATVRFETCATRSEEHTSELQSPMYLVCRLLLEKKKTATYALHPVQLQTPALISPSSTPCRAPSGLLPHSHQLRPPTSAASSPHIHPAGVIAFLP